MEFIQPVDPTSNGDGRALRLWKTLIASALVIGLSAGCGGDGSGAAKVVVEAPAAARTVSGAADLRAARPSIEAYYSDNGTYVGATADSLREIDSAIPDIVVQAATKTSYCVETANGSYHFAGPGGTASPGACP
jgi:hypothetical protein